MSVKALADYTQYAKYARYLPEKKRRETWLEQVDRVFKMHEDHLGDKVENIREEFEFAKEMLKKKRILGSQRALQFGGDPILRHNEKIYNCTASYIDRVDFFKEATYLLLCGSGVGFSAQKHHVERLPKIIKRDKGIREFVIPDSIEGWSDAIGILMQSYFDDKRDYYVYDLQSSLPSFSGYEVKFDYSLIRPEGSPISWGGLAPGPKGLENSINKIVELLDSILEINQKKLKPINVYDVVMHMSDAVLSGGIRRSATICLFSPYDEEMRNAKVGDWFITNPQRGRSNNSALLVRNETTREQFSELMKSVKEFGEPGFVWADNKETLFNPCCEVGFYNYDDNGKSGFGFCNLSEINGKKVKSEDDFYLACKAASIIGTIQASYDNFNYLSESSKNIVKKDALLGVSITGMMDNPDILFEPEIQRKGSKIVLDTNRKIANKIGINECARSTVIKPSGTASCILGSSSGIHAHQAKRYIRRVQANKLEFPVQHFQKFNPLAVEESVWSNNKTDLVISFLCEVPDGAKTKNQICALEMLEYVKITQQNWVEYGTRKNHPRSKLVPGLRQNVSNTIIVKENEWDDVEKYIYDNKKYFAGISLLPESGDIDYPQAPFSTILTEKEIVQKYGEGSLFASGLVVDGLHAFDNNLWEACDCALGIGKKIIDVEEIEEPIMPTKNGYTEKQWNKKLIEYTNKHLKYLEHMEIYQKSQMQLDWIRRFKQFSDRYLNGDYKKCSHLLKHVSLWKTWLDLKREYKEIDWSDVIEERQQMIDVSSLAGEACSGGKCELGDLGKSIDEAIKTRTDPTSAA